MPITIVDDFQKLPAEVLHRSYAHHAADFEPAEAIAKHALETGAAAGLNYEGKCHTPHLVLLDSVTGNESRIERKKLYAAAPRGAEREAAGMLAVAIAKRHGAGRWWSTGPAVLYVGGFEDPTKTRAAVIDGVPHAVLAAYYMHAAKLDR